MLKMTRWRFLPIFGICLITGFVMWAHLPGKVRIKRVTSPFYPEVDPSSFLHNRTEPAYENTDSLRNLTYDFVILDYVGYQRQKSDFVVNNCLVSQNRSLTSVANAIAIATRKLRRLQDLPRNGRSLRQRWVWILDESPYHSVDGQPFKLTDLNGVFNWTMSYRRDSDVFIPYGWTTRKNKPDKTLPDLGKRNRLITAAISNCYGPYVHNNRMNYIKELNKTAEVTLYGKCGKFCPGYAKNQQEAPCPEIKKSLFYLAFENANCKEYISEKLFGNAFRMGAVPIVMGAKKEEYARVTPPNSFIHVNDFTSPQKLGQYILSLSNNATAYLEFHEWRKEYSTDYRIQFVIRKGVWGPLCDKLNRDKGEFSTVSHLEKYWSISDCDNTPFKKS